MDAGVEAGVTGVLETGWPGVGVLTGEAGVVGETGVAWETGFLGEEESSSKTLFRGLADEILEEEAESAGERV